MPATILVVEDNPTTRKMLRTTLETEGYLVVEAQDARAALASAEESLPDLVLQDLILPDMDGLELLARFQALATDADLPVLALSGFLSRLEESRTTAAGFAALLVKPIEPSRLIDVIQTFLPLPKAAAATGADGRHLLLVDDDPVQLKLARIHFEQLGFDVAATTRARDALTMARARRPDVILSDVFMEDLDGFGLCLAIRQDPLLAGVPVVLVSNRYDSPADHDLAQRVGANALVARSPDFAAAIQATLEAVRDGAAVPAAVSGDDLKLRHAERVIQQLERQTGAMSGLAQRCALQAAQLALLSGVADALTRQADTDLALRDVIAATLDAAGISKGALMLKDDAGRLQLRQQIGFSAGEREALRRFFGHLPLLERVVDGGASISIPSSAVDGAIAREILEGAGVSSLQIAPLVSNGRGVGGMIIGATRTDVTSSDSVTFARAMGNQIVQSLELARSVAHLRASEQRYRTLLDSASDAIAVLTPDGIIREANHRWERITGRPRRELAGRNIGEFLRAPATGEPGAAPAILGGAASPGAPLSVATAAGTSVLLEFSSTNVDIAGERLIFAIGRDVTEHRALEDRLRQSQKLEAIGQLAGGVAHDFNNMLTAILGFADLILSTAALDDHVRADLMEIKGAGQRAAGLTRQLLAFSRKQILQPQVLDMNALIGGMEPMLRRLLFESITLTLHLRADVGRVRMDPSQLEQILVNLAVNAGDAMPAGGKLMLTTANATLGADHRPGQLPVAPGEYVMFEVTDTGTGMDDATAGRIFEPFFTTKDPGKGTGLGLATVYGIVKQSGGDISVVTDPGRGTTFRIYLPRVRDALTPAAIDAARPAGGKGSETILLVEDEDGVRRLARIALERSGYRVLEAASVDDAARIARDHDGPIHLVLSDVIMPPGDGPPLRQTLAELRPNVPVLYMSGYADDAIVRHGILVEATPFLQKPFTREELTGKVREVLDASGG